jgi:hypothetical protein
MHAWALAEGQVAGRGKLASHPLLRGLRSHPGWFALVVVAAASLADGRWGTALRNLLP